MKQISDVLDFRGAGFWYAVLAMYCLLHLAIRLSSSPNFSVDEAEQVLMSQSFQLGYRFRHPPLISWIYAAIESIGALNLWSLSTVKYIIMYLGFVAYFRAAKLFLASQPGIETGRSTLISGATVCAWGLVYFPAWGHHEDLMHTVLLFSLLAGCLDAFLRTALHGGSTNAVYLGLMVGLGALSKYVFLLFPLSLFCAALILRATSQTPLSQLKICRNHLALSLGVALLVTSPYIYWVLNADATLGALAFHVTGAEPDAGESATQALSLELEGILSFASAVVEFTLPLSLVFLFWWIAARSTPRSKPLSKPQEQIQRLLMLAIVVAIAAMAVPLWFGATDYKARWMHQIWIALPLLCATIVSQRMIGRSTQIIFWSLLVTLSAVLVIARLAIWHLSADQCNISKCREYLPSERFVAQLTPYFPDGGTLIGSDHQLVANLFSQINNVRGVATSFEYAAHPGPSGQGACVAIWRGDETPPDTLISYLKSDLNTDFSTVSHTGHVESALLKAPGRSIVINYAVLPSTPECR